MERNEDILMNEESILFKNLYRHLLEADDEFGSADLDDSAETNDSSQGDTPAESEETTDEEPAEEEQEESSDGEDSGDEFGSEDESGDSNDEFGSDDNSDEDDGTSDEASKEEGTELSPRVKLLYYKRYRRMQRASEKLKQIVYDNRKIVINSEEDKIEIQRRRDLIYIYREVKKLDIELVNIVYKEGIHTFTKDNIHKVYSKLQTKLLLLTQMYEKLLSNMII